MADGDLYAYGGRGTPSRPAAGGAAAAGSGQAAAKAQPAGGVGYSVVSPSPHKQAELQRIRAANDRVLEQHRQHQPRPAGGSGLAGGSLSMAQARQKLIVDHSRQKISQQMKREEQARLRRAEEDRQLQQKHQAARQQSQRLAEQQAWRQQLEQQMERLDVRERRVQRFDAAAGPGRPSATGGSGHRPSSHSQEHFPDPWYSPSGKKDGYEPC